MLELKKYRKYVSFLNFGRIYAGGIEMNGIRMILNVFSNNNADLYDTEGWNNHFYAKNQDDMEGWNNHFYAKSQDDIEGWNNHFYAFPNKIVTA